ncbi:MAG: type II secretion system protein GspE [Betaproteobacteria bacterium RIFCSPLOWO2_12_FULL_63_13]|nr:MAG: type II secretion system protein GspE [Betaproteobacteria bacterium RIFCSPLOWO2_02_FULL_63_19]OGA44572.1 MAG: type II secretion system protein GspE [Betaproteobacteria bacterium RIFCSPLOWO2_12_FULL_63_13]
MSIPARLPYTFAKSQSIILNVREDGGLRALVSENTPVFALAEVRRTVGALFEVDLLDAASFERELAETYSRTDQTAAEVADDIGQDLDLSRLVQELPPIEDLLEGEDDAPIIRMINALLTQAVRETASDIHIEPFERHSSVRFRIDGVLREVIQPHRALHAAMTSRIKIMAQMDIAEKRLPQDGRITIRIAGKPIDVRVSTIPATHGERVVMRLLDKDPSKLVLDVLGMAPDTLARTDALIHRPHGIFLVTGPTGSGKTTTLYAALSRLKAGELNIMTVEDPVEYDLPNIGQTQINNRIDLTFAKALRSILRQDPDVIMIGEIRDLETAQIAVQASLTGHLVLATLHTNDSASAVTRLVDMGVEPFLLASSLVGVLAQRLVRRLCPTCRQSYRPDASEEAQFARSGCPEVLYRAKGCAACTHTGYLGRMGIYELLEVDGALQQLIHERASEQRIRDHCVSSAGLRPLKEDGLRWVANGDTTLDEILRVTRD